MGLDSGAVPTEPSPSVLRVIKGGVAVSSLLFCSSDALTCRLICCVRSGSGAGAELREINVLSGIGLEAAIGVEAGCIAAGWDLGMFADVGPEGGGRATGRPRGAGFVYTE